MMKNIVAPSETQFVFKTS